MLLIRPTANLVGLWAGLALANTEIVNFAPASGLDVHVPQAKLWTCVNSTANELELSVAPARLHTPIADVCRRDTYLLGACPHEIWLRLHLDDLDWISFKKFTLRVSWPASSPADFWLETFTPEEIYRQHYGSAPDHSSLQTRMTYARVRVIDTGVRTPWPGVNLMAPAPDVRFRIICEPLLLGIIPQTLLPTVLSLVLVALVMSMLVGPVNKYLIQVADEARREIVNNKTKEL